MSDAYEKLQRDTIGAVIEQHIERLALLVAVMNKDRNYSVATILQQHVEGTADLLDVLSGYGFDESEMPQNIGDWFADDEADR